MGRVIFLTLFICLSVCGTVWAEGGAARVGTVKNSSGDAFVVRAGHRLPAVPGMELRQGDRLVTGGSGRLGVLLSDDTALSLGPSTESSIESFLYSPDEGRLGMVLRVARGVFGYLSGKIAKLAPGSVRVETPVATLGVRGTYFVARIVP